MTDIAVLVVAADDGVMPQTEEAISHARAAEVPIVVALNKIDLPGANPQRAYEQLAANELLPSEWGGETEVVKTSATTGEGIDTLLETLLTVAELHEYKANPDGPARGTCLESEMHEDRGVIVKLLVQNGTLHVGDVVVCGAAYGRVKAMYDTLEAARAARRGRAVHAGERHRLELAPRRRRPLLRAGRHHPGPPTGRTSGPPRPASANWAAAAPHVTLENLYERLGEESKVQTLNIILRRRRARLDRGHPQGTFQAAARRGADQDAAGHGGRHHRGRRAPGPRLRRRDHRLLGGARRRGPRCWPTSWACRSAATTSSTR